MEAQSTAVALAEVADKRAAWAGAAEASASAAMLGEVAGNRAVRAGGYQTTAVFRRTEK